ncbi:MAG TPA: protein translocase subunit SecD [Candidatus Cybelea sp.]|nr:protein translocase subunit SecD [Candidatus Cybelea sp.]
MMYFPPWKVALIIGVCLLGIIFSAPNLLTREQAAKLPPWLPHSQLNLGLDLRGGSHLLLEVDLNAVVQERLQNLVESARTELRKQHINYTGGLGVSDNKIIVHLRDPEQKPQALDVLKGLASPVSESIFSAGQKDLTVSEGPDNTLVVELSQAAVQQRAQSAVQQSIEIVRRRIDETGVNEPSIQVEGRDRILVQLPGIDDPDRVKRLIGKTAKLTFRMVDTSPEAAAGRVPPGSEVLPSEEGKNERTGQQRPAQYIVRKKVEVAGDDLVDAQAGYDQRTGEPVVNFRFNTSGARKFGETTRENVGKPFAIVLDNKVLSAPNIREPILGGSGQISGSFTVQSANDLAVLLRAGALPAPLKIIEERTVGPDLGADSIRAGEIASAIGFTLVVLFMFASYGFFGLLANVALLFNLFLILGALSLLQATLTLPGIAGILLTIGMAVDANVLINERIREETRHGKTPLAAMDAGFTRAFATILDSNLTTLIKMALLFAFGSGTVKGFAVTISLGIITSMFTAILGSRLMMATWLRRRRPQLLPV